MVCLIALALSVRADVVLVQDGAARIAIHVDAGIMAPDKKDALPTFVGREAETQRQRLRESVKDLADYLQKMSGAHVGIFTNAPMAGDAMRPILIGERAARKFGTPRTQAPYKQGFRVVVSEKGVGLMGESDLATSYAIYELLERVGCRWYMPSEMGEVIPAAKTVRLPDLDFSSAPGTLYRGIWYGDDSFKRRIRQGGLLLSAGHALEISNYITKEQLQAHPDWCGLIRGKRDPSRFCWANAEAATAVADGIIAQLDQAYAPTVSLSPNDGADFCECDQCKALDAGDMDPTMGTTSVTDRFVHFNNRIAERVTQKYPEVLFGFLAYAQYTRPPVRETLNPNLVPQIAPITYCRAHTMLQANTCPSRPLIRPIVEGWGRKARRVSYYGYMYHLAEPTVPYPMMKQMSDELPLVYANNVKFWQPETLPNFESVLPGMVLTIRMAWDPKTKPAEVLDEFFTKFYGAAAVPMRRYWQLFDEAWTKVPEHAGCGFGYARRFTPEMMKAARAAMEESLAACRTDLERRRVMMHHEALKQFERFMKLRRDLFEGRLANLDGESELWLQKQIALGNEYAPQFAFTKARWTPDTAGGHYFKAFFRPAYVDGTRIARNYAVIQPPLRQWRYQVDREKKGEALGWPRSEFDDRGWKTTDLGGETWSALGLDLYYGPVFYRAKADVPSLPAGRKVWLWISGTDGDAKVFANGQPIPYVNEKGEKSDRFSGFCQPASFDITRAVRVGAENQITIVGTRQFINELGTGGLLGPVLLYTER